MQMQAAPLLPQAEAAVGRIPQAEAVHIPAEGAEGGGPYPDGGGCTWASCIAGPAPFAAERLSVRAASF